MMSAKRSPNGEKSFRIDDLLQRKTIDDENVLSINSVSGDRHAKTNKSVCDSPILDLNKNTFKSVVEGREAVSSKDLKVPKDTKDSKCLKDPPERLNGSISKNIQKTNGKRDFSARSPSPEPRNYQKYPHSPGSQNYQNPPDSPPSPSPDYPRKYARLQNSQNSQKLQNSQNSQNPQNSQKFPNSPPSPSYHNSPGKNSQNSSPLEALDKISSISSSPPYPPYNPYEAQRAHLLNPMHLQFNGFGPVFPPGPYNMPSAATNLSMNSSSNSGNSGNSSVNSVNSGESHNMSHYPLFSNFLLPSHHNYLMPPTSGHHHGHVGSLWGQGAHLNPALVPGAYLDSRGLPYSTFLSRLAAPYGVSYGNGRLNPLISMGSKRKGGQIRFSNSQTAQLEKAFFKQKYLNAIDRKKLAHSLALSDRQVKTWFQNRRAKSRKIKDKEDLPPGYTNDDLSPDPQSNQNYSNRCPSGLPSHEMTDTSH